MLETVLWIVGIYLGAMPLIYLWDAKFGWRDDPDNESNDTVDFGDLFWWPLLLLMLPFYLTEKWQLHIKR